MRSDLGQRLEDEGPLAESRVRHDESGLVDDLATVEDQIEVERARRVPVGTLPPEALLDREESVQQGARRQRRGADDGRVQVPGLWRGSADRRSVVKGRGPNAAEERAELSDGARERRCAVAEIAAEGDGDGDARRVSRRSSG